ncbi:MAG: cadherin repeat domain-containing protein [Candidatus Caenarcaniphilales bacterium]|nr:cadherin repeat domain-containing protein [Candidatus Caenarcaniphilales bacterium]
MKIKYLISLLFCILSLGFAASASADENGQAYSVQLEKIVRDKVETDKDLKLLSLGAPRINLSMISPIRIYPDLSINTKIGTFSIENSAFPDTYLFSVKSGSSRFSIRGTSLYLKSGSYTSTRSYDLTVEAISLIDGYLLESQYRITISPLSDSGGSSGSDDEPEPVANNLNISLSNNEIEEGEYLSFRRQEIGEFTTTGGSRSFTSYDIVSGDARLSELAGKLRFEGVLDYDETKTMSVTISARNGSDTATKTFTIKVIEKDSEPPVINSISEEFIDYDTPINTVIATVDAVDEYNPNDKLKYTMRSDTVPGLFRIDEEGNIRLSMFVSRIKRKFLRSGVFQCSIFVEDSNGFSSTMKHSFYLTRAGSSGVGMEPSTLVIKNAASVTAGAALAELEVIDSDQESGHSIKVLNVNKSRKLAKRFYIQNNQLFSKKNLRSGRFYSFRFLIEDQDGNRKLVRKVHRF